MRRSFVGLGLVAALSGFGCFRQVYVASGTLRTEEPNHSHWENHLLWGLINASGDADLRALCPGGVSQIYSRFNVINWLVSVVTAGIWTPFSVDIWCNVGAPGASAPPSHPPTAQRGSGPVSLRIEVRPSAELLRRWRAQTPEVDMALREAGVDITSLPGAAAIASRGRTPTM